MKSKAYFRWLFPLLLIIITAYYLNTFLITILDFKDYHEIFISYSEKSGSPVGGGKAYNNYVSNETYYVANKKEFLEVLKKLNGTEVIYIADTAKINLSSEQNIRIPENVTIASGRGLNSSLGGLIFSNNVDHNTLFAVTGSNVRFTGLRIFGPDTLIGDSAYQTNISHGIACSVNNLEVDNCELKGWTHAAILLLNGAANAYIHHNYIHHNRRKGLGYGVCVGFGNTNALIEANLFDWNRHDIAGNGSPGNNYKARYNIVLDNGNGHSFDMHGGKDRGDNTNIASDSMNIYQNAFFNNPMHYAIKIRGEPIYNIKINNNLFYHPTLYKHAIRLENVPEHKQGKFIVKDNTLKVTWSNYLVRRIAYWMYKN